MTLVIKYLVEPNPNALGLNCFPNYEDFVWLLFGSCSQVYILKIYHRSVWVFSSTERTVLTEDEARKDNFVPC